MPLEESSAITIALSLFGLATIGIGWCLAVVYRIEGKFNDLGVRLAVIEALFREHCKKEVPQND